jgi:hypothetical protein
VKCLLLMVIIIFHQIVASQARTDLGSEKHQKNKTNTKPIKRTKKVPKTTDELKKYIKNDFKRDNRFAHKKDQDDLTDRLLSHRERSENHKLLLKVAQQCEEDLSSYKKSKSRKSSTSHREMKKTVNSKSFYENQIEHEKVKKQRLMMEMHSKQADELSQITNPKISNKSKRLASSRDRKGLVYERLHNESKRKLLESLENDSVEERPNSCNRKGIKMLLMEEQKDLTFKPQISRSKHSSREMRVEDRLLEDAHNRKIRKTHMQKQEMKRIKN